MSKGPKWFQALPHKGQEVIEQTLHFLMGFAARLVFLDLLLWYREAITQWPPGDTVMVGGKPYAPHDRVWDTMTDMKWYAVGGTVADIVRIGGLVYWALT